MSGNQKLIVTHHAPDLDAISSIWLLQRFDAQHYAGSRVAFVNPGDTITEQEAAQKGAALEETTHVDTGLGEFDHHDAVRGLDRSVCSATLVYDHLIKVHPDLTDDQTLKTLIAHVLDVDHFGEAFWPDANHPRYQFMLLHIIDGMDATLHEDDQYQVDFGSKCLDFIYASLNNFLRAQEKIATKGKAFPIKDGQALAIETSNDDVVSVAQKDGYQLVIRKDSKNGQARIKARPDTPFDLRRVYERVVATDQTGYWFYHPSGKMVLNGSNKTTGKTPTPLSLDELVKIVQEELGA